LIGEKGMDRRYVLVAASVIMIDNVLVRARKGSSCGIQLGGITIFGNTNIVKEYFLIAAFCGN
jgi:hypothetical protein